MAKASLEQLKSKVWSSEANAARDLKRAGFEPRGEDYEIGRSPLGGWTLLPRIADVSDSAPDPAPIAEPKPTRKARTRKGAASVESTPPEAEPDHAAEIFPQSSALITEAIAEAEAESASDSHIESGLFAEDPEPELPPEPAIVESPPDLSTDVERPAPVTGSLSLIDLRAVPDEDGPYDLIIHEAEPECFPKSTAVATALTISRVLKGPIHIRNRAGQIVRTIDARLLPKNGPKRAADPNNPPTPRRTGGTRPIGTAQPIAGMAADVLALASRPEGVPRPELVALDPARGWKSALQGIGKKAGLTYRSEKNAEGVTIYFLHDLRAAPADAG